MDAKKQISLIAPGRQIPEHAYPNRRAVLKGIGFGCLGLASFLNGCYNINSESKDLQGIKERKNMELAMNSSVPGAPIPPIDARAPAETETATFSLG
jgi:hypothetical protein